MNDALSLQDLREMLLYASAKIIESEPLLTQIDQQAGDGDHGTNMALGFGAVRNLLIEQKEFSNVRVLFKDCGMTLIDTMGGTSGILFGTLFISGAAGLPDGDTLSLEQFCGMLERSLNAIQTRGRAKLGDKTIVDALEPAVTGLRHALQTNMKLTEALVYAALRAKEGMESTIAMRAKAGRAKAYREQSIGVQDAGATSVYILFQAMSDYLQNIFE